MTNQSNVEPAVAAKQAAPEQVTAAQAAAAEQANDPIFAQEQAHLTQVHATLTGMAKTLGRTMLEAERKAADEKDVMTDDVFSAHGTVDDTFETTIDLAMVNQVIEDHNRQQSAWTEKLRTLGMLLEQPYFAKVTLRFKPDDPAKDLYIGNAGMSDDDYRRLVVDWRSPVAETYYNQDLGPTSYRANGRTITCDVELRRQFDIDRDLLKGYFDTTIAIQDPLLLASLNRTRSTQMKDITSTIQKEQNTVIRYDDVPALLVSGVAGSGKTSVLMQRIAYLFYQQRGSLNAEDVCLITPNPVFGHYIESVLPDLGERNPVICTRTDLLASLLPKGRGIGKPKATPERLQEIADAVAERLTFDANDFLGVACNGRRILTAGAIRKVRGLFKRVPPSPRLATLMREELLVRLDARMRDMAASEEILDEVSRFSLQEQISRFGCAVELLSGDELKERLLAYVMEEYGDAFRQVECDEWIDIDGIGRRILGVTELDALEWLYLKMCCTGMSKPSVKYVMIDEVQDYSAAELALWARYFSRANFMLLGDEYQAIAAGTADFDQVKAVFEAARGGIDECKLLTSYRSSPEITALFAGLLPERHGMEIKSVQRDCEPPVRYVANSTEDYAAFMAGVVRDAWEADGTTAIIAADKAQARWVLRQLESVEGVRLPAFADNGQELPDEQVVLITLKTAKGLEFDHVVVADAQQATFGTDDLSRNRLYTTISRATRQVTIVANGPLTPLL